MCHAKISNDAYISTTIITTSDMFANNSPASSLLVVERFVNISAEIVALPNMCISTIWKAHSATNPVISRANPPENLTVAPMIRYTPIGSNIPANIAVTAYFPLMASSIFGTNSADVNRIKNAIAFCDGVTPLIRPLALLDRVTIWLKSLIYRYQKTIYKLAVGLAAKAVVKTDVYSLLELPSQTKAVVWHCFAPFEAVKR